MQRYIFALLFVSLLGTGNSLQAVPCPAGSPAGSHCLGIASWNVEHLTPGKFGNALLLSYMSRLMAQFDVILLQEVQMPPCGPGLTPPPGSAACFEQLCTLPAFGGNYTCQVSNRYPNPGGNNERYALVYNHTDPNLTVAWTGLTVNPPLPGGIPQGAPGGTMGRPPLRVQITFHTLNFPAFDNHIRPQTTGTSPVPLVVPELNILQPFVETPGGGGAPGNPSMILGDLNAQGTYFPGGFAAHPGIFPCPAPPAACPYSQAIPDATAGVPATATNFGAVQKAYDRIILTAPLDVYRVDQGIIPDMPGVVGGPNYSINTFLGGGQASDHKLVFTTLRVTPPPVPVPVPVLPAAATVVTTWNYQGSFANTSASVGSKRKQSSVQMGDAKRAQYGLGGTPPGDRVGVQGRGFKPGETVKVHVFHYQGRNWTGSGPAISYASALYKYPATANSRGDFFAPFIIAPRTLSQRRFVFVVQRTFPGGGWSPNFAHYNDLALVEPVYLLETFFKSNPGDQLYLNPPIPYTGLKLKAQGQLRAIVESEYGPEFVSTNPDEAMIMAVGKNFAIKEDLDLLKRRAGVSFRVVPAQTDCQAPASTAKFEYCRAHTIRLKPATPALDLHISSAVEIEVARVIALGAIFVLLP